MTAVHPEEYGGRVDTSKGRLKILRSKVLPVPVVTVASILDRLERAGTIQHSSNELMEFVTNYITDVDRLATAASSPDLDSSPLLPIVRWVVAKCRDGVARGDICVKIRGLEYLQGRGNNDLLGGSVTL